MANGVFPADYTTDVGKVRILIPDVQTEDGTVNTDYMFSDDQIEALLELFPNVKLAAAAAIDVVANDQVLLYKVVRTDDLSVNGASVADALRKRAVSLRDEVAAGEVDHFEIVYPQTSVFIPEGTVPVYGRQYGWGLWR